jgi:hypothetical protein
MRRAVEAGVRSPLPDHDDDVPPPSGDRQVPLVVWILGGVGLVLAYILALVLLQPHA